MKKWTVMQQCMIAFGIVLNVVGAFMAMNLRLPIYLDSVGTIFTGALLGPAAGMMTGACGSIISGMTFDIYSLYYAPAQLLTGYMAGIMFRTVWMKDYRLPLGNLAISLPTTAASAVVTSFLFGGITSSGSTYLVMLLNKLGMNLTLSCFVVQALTDYADELVAALVVTALLKVLTPEMRAKISGS